MSSAPRASAPSPADVEAWLTELGLEPLERADREGVTSWDLVLDGRRRAAFRITLILDPSLALICWAHYAPPINDSFRKSYRKLLHWNDELPFVKFSVGEDERPLLVVELPIASVDRNALGLALARQIAIADRYHDETIDWLKAGGWRTSVTDATAAGPGTRLLDRYATDLAAYFGDDDERPESPPLAAEPRLLEPPAAADPVDAARPGAHA
jgi:hypothetical protein